ncbi:hypothetical protein OSB04_017353 [Centaurea solstitialis]|uniref:ARM repeat superfamily protein n=1 Tax=Centaurea solstitialis TaxID=347529 RepID=A0AA38TAA5_9ASTR|nr:hypothetical protein OSB04_017353 [Centaurea solstitialis]
MYICTLVPDERAIEEEAEKKIGWLFKLIFAGTATFRWIPYLSILGYLLCFVNHLHDYFSSSTPYQQTSGNLIQQSVSLLNVKDPLFKRMGASRLARFATDDERRMKIVEMGGVQKLVDMLGAATDDRTRKETLNAIVAIARKDEAVRALQSPRAISVIMATPESSKDAEIERCKGKLLRRLGDLKHDENSSPS